MPAPRRKMLHLSMDDELHDALGEYARQNRRSLTNALEFILAGALCPQPADRERELAPASN